MTNTVTWTPTIESGLSGVVYPEQALDPHVDDRHSPGVYALRCSLPETTCPGVYRDLWLDEYGVLPEFFDHLCTAHRLIYVGAAKDLLDRLIEHVEAPNRSASVCRVFPIHDVIDAWEFDSAAEAFERETGIAIDWQNEHPEDYVHVR